MQALYAYFQANEHNIDKASKNLITNIYKIQELYIYLLSLLCEVKNLSYIQIEKAKDKYLPTYEDLNPNLKFVNNLVLKTICESNTFKQLVNQYKISWDAQESFVRNLLLKIKASETYTQYMQNGNENNLAEDAKLLTDIFEELIILNDYLIAFFEEKNINWADDLDMANILVLRSIENIKKTNYFSQIQLFRNDKEDINFIETLFRKVIEFNEELNDILRKHTKNWDLERLAILDVILLKMAITELRAPQAIAPQLIINEYIEIAKDYSTEKSGAFINGILGKVAQEY